MTRPGDRFRRIAQRLCSPQTMERLIDPAVADLQHEHAAAVAAQEPVRAAGALLRGYWSLLKVGACGFSQSDAARGPIASLAAIVVITAALDAWPMWRFAHAVQTRATGSLAVLLLCLVPQALALSVPAGVGLAAFIAWRDPAARRRNRRVVLTIALVASVVTLANGQWLTPEANQRFRETIAGRPLVPGAAEVPLTEMWRHIRAGGEYDFGAIPISRLFHTWLSMAATPFALACFVLAAAGIERRSGRRAVTAATLLGFVVLLSPELRRSLLQTLPIVVVAWLPNAFVVAAASAVTAVQRATRSAA